MAYNRRNTLEKIMEVQEITMREKKRGATQAWIFRNLICKQFHISKSTFDRYLSTNAKKELAKLDKR